MADVQFGHSGTFFLHVAEQIDCSIPKGEKIVLAGYKAVVWISNFTHTHIIMMGDRCGMHNISGWMMDDRWWRRSKKLDIEDPFIN